MELELEDLGSNPTDNRPFEDIAGAYISRRGLLGGSLAVAAATFFTGTGVAGAKGKPSGAPGRGPATAEPLIGFDAIPLDGTDQIKVAAGYTATPFLPWGTPILPGAGGGRYPANAAEQAKRIGLGHDGMWFFPTTRSGDRGILCLNLEFGTNGHIANGTGMTPGTPEFVELSQAAHGVAVVEIQRTAAGWQVVMGSNNRRITATTPVVEFTGPAAGHPLLQTTAGDEPAGTLNNCANGHTPWGTYLTCEENFNGYFGATGAWTATPEQKRYGFSAGGFGYGWHVHDPRFDLSNPGHVNRENQGGWVMEIDPQRPGAAPVKRTALGRFKHENAEVVEGRGKRIVVYMGDDERFDYIYKFVSDSNWKSMRARGMSPLDHGTLYAAKFADDGTGTWLPLTIEDPALAARFEDQGELVTFARIAGDVVGATPMDRPEWATAGPNGDIFFALTNNSRRTEADAANPRSPNPDGHIIRIEDGDHVGTTFEWDIFLIAGDGASSGDGSTVDAEDAFGSPDGLYADPDGRLFIQTDGSQPNGTNDQMLVADTRTGELRRMFTGIPDGEVTGVARTPDRKTMFINVQHPGNGDPGVSSFPDYDGATPRDSVVVITKDDGGVIGT